MVSIRGLSESDLGEALELQNQYTAQDRAMAEFRSKFRATPVLFLGADDDGNLVGICLGWPTDSDVVELVGIDVAPARRGWGIGSRLLEQFETNAEDLGIQKITLGSAGGAIDRFYVSNGYSPSKILVRGTAETLPADYRNLGYDVVKGQSGKSSLKIHLGVDEYDPSDLETIRERFQDDEAIYIMEKTFSGE